MRKRGRHLAPRLREISRGWVIPMSLAMLLVSTTVAWGDQVINTIDTTVDSALETRTITAGASTTVGFWVSEAQSMGQTTPSGDTQGCNVGGGTTTTATLSVPSGVTASPSSFDFSGCGTSNAVSVQFSSNTSGTYTIGIASVAGGKSGSLWDAGPASFTLIVEPATPSDTTPPVITPSVSGTLGNNGWYTSDVTVTWSVVDNESAISSTSGCGSTTIDTDTGGTTLTCTATSAGGTSTQSVTIMRDATAPTISGSASPSPNANGWYKTNVGVAFTCGDNLSEVASCGPNQTLSSEGADQSATGTAVDNAGNSVTTTVSGINIDKTAPTITSWSNGPLDGASYYFGSVPAAPTCEADDSLSGLTLAGCVVSGYDTTVGSHTMTASGSDLADNVGTDTRSYEVLSWSLSGFYSPVDMSQSSIVYNTVKGGSTVPLKFEIFAGPTELTTTSSIASFSATKIACVGGTSEDALEFTTTGATTLRYDSTAGQFIQNWQTPKAAGNCYRVTMTTQDGSYISAYFRIK